MQSTLLLVFLALACFARADYYIDDQNYTSLIYSENTTGATWGPYQENGNALSVTLVNGTAMAVDASQCFNQTFTYAACTTSDNCQVQIPFVGSGIAIYVLQAGSRGINASLTIDGVTTYKVLHAPPRPNLYTPNVTLFSVQGIISGNHTATMTVLDWDKRGQQFSGMMFDYALINETLVLSSPSSVTSSPSPSGVTTVVASPSKTTVDVGAIVGAGVAGVVGLSAIGLVIFYLRRRRQRPQKLSANLDADPKVEPFFRPELSRSQSALIGRHTEVMSAATRTVGSTTSGSDSYRGLAHGERLQLHVMNPGASASEVTRVGSSKSRAGAPDTLDASGLPSRTPTWRTRPVLSDEQADVVDTLYANNVPPRAIARVIESMISGERFPVMDECGGLPPPSYSHVTSSTHD